jgi:hypothetical protein
MRRLFTLCGCIALFSVLALAESWTGRLVDASCYDQHKTATACDPSASTSSFSLVVSGQAYKLDNAGNGKASEALKNRADRSANPNQPPKGAVSAKVTGIMANDTISVESIDVQ